MWIFIVLAQLSIAFAGIRKAQRAGVWSWPRFFFILGFAAFECAILLAPIYFIHDVHNRYFVPAYVGAWVVVLVNLVWMICFVRRWKWPPPKRNR